MKCLYLILILITLNSCIELNGITNDYDKLSQSQKDKIEKLNEFDNLETGKIYSINAPQLMKEMKKYPKSLVYVFANGCRSEYCKALSIYEDFAKKQNYKLYLVMNGYNNLYETTNQPISSPLFSIDSDYYGVKSRTKYTIYFENELQGKAINTKPKEFLGSLYFFENGKFENILRELPKQ